MNKRRLATLGCFLMLAACAGEPEVVSPLRVDLETVVAAGSVRAVDGLTAAEQPDEAALKVFAGSGYAAVIDLRTAGESRGLDEPAVVEALGMDYVSLPVGRDGITFDNAMSLDALIESYEGPVLVHCGSSNRVGALLALRASMDGADNETAIAHGKKGGLTSLEATVRAVLGSK